ncbi:MAG: serine/threonine protein kinase [Verrucomicrobiales bacterium]|nr:serine/threonine protein kinase [Verrucomicrobiales bacterium]
MATPLSQDDPGSGGGPEISDVMLREAYLAGNDPEVTLFLDCLRDLRRETAPIVPGSWRANVHPPESADEIGRIDGHILLELLAEGCMAVVFRAREIALDRIVALKMLSPELAGIPEARGRFLREAKSAAGLVHENVLPIHRVGEDPLPYFTMRLVTGGTLQDRLDRGESLSGDTWTMLARQAAGALGAAHAVGIIHRDVKPANLLFDEGGRLWMADFGIAASLHDPLPAADHVLGTPRYMSPEQARAAVIDGRSDLFALGAVLYRCAAGEDLVAGESSAEVFASLDATDFAAMVRADARLTGAQRRLLAGLLASRVEDRFPDAASFLAALEEEVKTGSSGTRRGPLSRPWLTVLVALVVLAIFSSFFHVSRSLRPATGAAKAAPAPSLPEIRIEGRDGVYRDFSSAFAAATSGSILLLDGVFVVRETHFGPEGVDLTMRSAPGAHAVVIASLPDQHALFFRGPTRLHDLTFVRDSGTENVVPIVGIHGGDALVRNCRFETMMPEVFLLGASLSFTNLEEAVIDRCIFRTRGRDAVGLGFVQGSPAMKLTVKDSIFLAGVGLTRRIWEGEAGLSVEWERSILVADIGYLEHPRNRSDHLSPLSFETRACVFDLAEAMIRLGNGHDPLAAGTRVAWQGEGNRHAVDGLRMDWTAMGGPASEATVRGISLEPDLAPPFLGGEISPKVAPYVERGAEPVTLDELFDIIRADPGFSDLVDEGAG